MTILEDDIFYRIWPAFEGRRLLCYHHGICIFSFLASPHMLRDRDLNTFALAEGAFYHFGLLSTPTRARALLNWALVLEHVRRDPAQAGEPVVDVFVFVCCWYMLKAQWQSLHALLLHLVIPYPYRFPIPTNPSRGHTKPRLLYVSNIKAILKQYLSNI